MRIRAHLPSRGAVFVVIAALVTLITSGVATYRLVQLPPPAGPPQVWLERIFPDVPLSQPIHLAEFPDGSGEFAVVERAGRIVRIPKGGNEIHGELLDISERVALEDADDGLFIIAFHPRFAENHQFFVFYTGKTPRRTVISRFVMDPGTRAASAGGEEIIYEVEHPADKRVYHHGGTILFGPDGMLWISTGDSQRKNLVQNLKRPHGKILRIDVDHPSDGKPYGIPADNPFVGKSGVLPEIWAYGLRNPWRFSIDPVTGNVYAGDVGSHKWDEIDRVVPGGNYGWPDMEGFRCYKGIWFCNRERYLLPLTVTKNEGRTALIGGYVYRGESIPWLRGKFVFGDYMRGLYAIDTEGDTETQDVLIRWEEVKVALALNRFLIISSIAEDLDRELYVMDYTGAAYRIVSLAERAGAD